MSELETFRDHCRAMADPKPPRPDVGPFCRSLWKGDKPDHGKCTKHAPTGVCGCRCHPWNAPQPEPDRRLWAALADEVDRYLAGDDDADEPLFGEGS